MKFSELVKRYPSRTPIFELKKGKRQNNTFIPIGIRKGLHLKSKIRRCRLIGEDYNILELMQQSRKQLLGTSGV